MDHIHIDEYATHCPTNNSKAKQMFSFPKAPRLVPPKKPLCETYYEVRRLPTADIQFAPRFAGGERFIQYRTPTNHQSQSPKKRVDAKSLTLRPQSSKMSPKGISFGMSREAYKKVFCENLIQVDETIPGPAQYQVSSFVDKLISRVRANPFPKRSPSPNTNLEYTKMHNTEVQLKQKYLRKLKKPLPGPGEYQVVEKAGIRADGKYPIAKLRYGGTLKFGTGERDNYMVPRQKTPGPGTYDLRGISIAYPEGRCALSSYKSAKGARFSKGKRPFSAALTLRQSVDDRSTTQRSINERDFYDNRLPGPGYYQLVSEFGTYNFWDRATAGKPLSKSVIGGGAGASKRQGNTSRRDQKRPQSSYLR